MHGEREEARKEGKRERVEEEEEKAEGDEAASLLETLPVSSYR